MEKGQSSALGEGGVNLLGLPKQIDQLETRAALNKRSIPPRLDDPLDLFVDSPFGEVLYRNLRVVG